MPEFNPSRVAKDLTRADAIGIIHLGFITDITALEALIPTDADSTWTANPEDHIKYGMKYQWRNDTVDTNRWMIRFHAPDLKAPSSISNATVYWTVRIQCQKQMLQTGTPPEFKPFSQSDANKSHIPIKHTVSNLKVLHDIAIRMSSDTLTTSRQTLNKRTGVLN